MDAKLARSVEGILPTASIDALRQAGPGAPNRSHGPSALRGSR
jgi:hypothetical protein